MLWVGFLDQRSSCAEWVCMFSIVFLSRFLSPTDTLGWLTTLHFVCRCECELLFVSGRGPVINWPPVSDSVSETVKENRQLDGIQSSLAVQILFLAHHCSFFSSCKKAVCLSPEPLPFCLSQTKLALQKQLSKALPAGFLTSPLNPAALCTMASGPMALRLPPGPTAIIQGPLINPTLFRPAPGPLRTTHAPIIFSPYWPWARNRFGVKEWSSSNWARCRWTLSWSDWGQNSGPPEGQRGPMQRTLKAACRRVNCGGAKLWDRTNPLEEWHFSTEWLLEAITANTCYLYIKSRSIRNTVAVIF